MPRQEREPRVDVYLVVDKGTGQPRKLVPASMSLSDVKRSLADAARVAQSGRPRSEFNVRIELTGAQRSVPTNVTDILALSVSGKP